ncbi:DUF977 family protein [Patescibacteria group bacterium]|nr:DUF977 family protein [Patescibacteria group bacterium]
MSIGILIIIVLIISIIVWGYFYEKEKEEQKKSRGSTPTDLIPEQSKRKQENKQKILEFLRENGRVTNNDVEKLCEVSDNTAERYLDDLEKEGYLIQNGEIGRGVFYILKNK